MFYGNWKQKQLLQTLQKFFFIWKEIQIETSDKVDKPFQNGIEINNIDHMHIFFLHALVILSQPEYWRRLKSDTKYCQK